MFAIFFKMKFFSIYSFQKILTPPNLLCLFRIAMTPIIGFLIIGSDFPSALILCAISAITDFLDGWIARTFHCESKLGAVLDPLADKLLIATLALTLTYVDLIPLWLTSLIFLRDFLIVLGGFYMRFKSLQSPITLSKFFDIDTFSVSKYRPTFISKLNTGLQLSLVLATLSFSLTTEYLNQYEIILNFLQLITGVTTFWSGIIYLKRLW